MTRPLLSTICLSVISLAALSGCSEKPCDEIPDTANVKRLDMKISGAKLCKDDRGVASLDFPGKDIGSVKKAYESHFTDAGWKTHYTKESDKLPIVVFEKGSDKLMVTVGKSSDRHITFAMIKYCAPSGSPGADGCVRMITELAKALDKN